MGINSADLYNAIELRNDQLIYYRTKTKDRRLDKAKMIVTIPKMVQPIIKKYRDDTGKRLFLFYRYYRDPKAFNKALNKGLKEIGKQLKIFDLKTFDSRRYIFTFHHTFYFLTYNTILQILSLNAKHF